MDPGLVLRDIGELNGNSFSCVDAGQLHPIQISRNLKRNRITEQRSWPPVEGVVERIAQHKANLAELAPDCRLGGKGTRWRWNRRRQRRERESGECESAKTKRTAIQHL
jgi:hypothetical protein